MITLHLPANVLFFMRSPDELSFDGNLFPHVTTEMMKVSTRTIASSFKVVSFAGCHVPAFEMRNKDDVKPFGRNYFILMRYICPENKKWNLYTPISLSANNVALPYTERDYRNAVKVRP